MKRIPRPKLPLDTEESATEFIKRATGKSISVRMMKKTIRAHGSNYGAIAWSRKNGSIKVNEKEWLKTPPMEQAEILLHEVGHVVARNRGIKYITNLVNSMLKDGLLKNKNEMEEFLLDMSFPLAIDPIDELNAQFWVIKKARDTNTKWLLVTALKSLHDWKNSDAPYCTAYHLAKQRKII